MAPSVAAYHMLPGGLSNCQVGFAHNQGFDYEADGTLVYYVASMVDNDLRVALSCLGVINYEYSYMLQTRSGGNTNTFQGDLHTYPESFNPQVGCAHGRIVFIYSAFQNLWVVSPRMLLENQHVSIVFTRIVPG